jgi:uncharacterized protein with PIN domain
VIATADRCLVSAVTYQEAGHVLIAKGGINGLHDLEDFLAFIRAEIVPRDIHLAASALKASRRYGKGVDPNARLDFCDLAGSLLACYAQLNRNQMAVGRLVAVHAGERHGQPRTMPSSIGRMPQVVAFGKERRRSDSPEKSRPKLADDR